MPTYQTLVRTHQGGTTIEVASGGTLDLSGQAEVESGGTLRIKSGGRGAIDSGGSLVAPSGAISVGGTGITNTFVDGVASGYKIARGTAVLAGGSAVVASGLTTAVVAVAGLRGTLSPGTLTQTISANIGASGTVTFYGWMITAPGTATLIASTGTETFNWFAVGT